MYYLYYLTFTPICNNILHQEVVLHKQVLSRIYMYLFLSKYFLLEFIFSSCSSQELLCKVLYDITNFEWWYSSLKGTLERPKRVSHWLQDRRIPYSPGQNWQIGSLGLHQKSSGDARWRYRLETVCLLTQRSAENFQQKFLAAAELQLRILKFCSTH